MSNSTYSRFKFLKLMFRQAPLKPADRAELQKLAKTFDPKLAEWLIDSGAVSSRK